MTWTTRPRSDFGGLAAIVAGEGPLLLLLHGVGLRAEAWSPVIDALSPRFRVVAPDMPGHGQSAHSEDCSTLSDYREAIARGVDGPALVAGHSMGAMIALSLAATAPETIRAVLALNAIFQRTPNAAEAVRGRAAELDGASTPNPEATLNRWFGAKASPERAACEEWLRTVDPKGYKAAYTVFAQEDGPSPGLLETLAQPSIFMTGAEDPNSTPEMAHRMAHLAPLGQSVTTAGAAHMLPMTHPGDVVQALDRLSQNERS